MKNTCPVCGYAMPFPPEDNNICSSCGTEFGYDDTRKTYGQLRHEWVVGGAEWFSSYAPRPSGWNPWLQLIEAGFIYDVPHYEIYRPPSVIICGEANLPTGLHVQFT